MSTDTSYEEAAMNEFNKDSASENPIGGTQRRDELSETEKLGSGVSIQNVVKRFGDVAAVNGVTLDIMHNPWTLGLRQDNVDENDCWLRKAGFGRHLAPRRVR